MIEATSNERPFPFENVHIVFFLSTPLFPTGLPAELMRTFSGSLGLLYARSVCGLPRSRAGEVTVNHADVSLSMSERYIMQRTEMAASITSRLP